MTRTTAPDWTPEEDAWLREAYPLHPNAELVGMKPGTPRSKLSIQTRAARLGLAKAVMSARVTMRRSELARERRRIEGHPWASDARFAQ